MVSTQLSNRQWQAYFDQIARLARSAQVYIEAAGLNIGAQVEADWLPLIGISYDPRNAVLSVTTDRIEHLINHPREIKVQYAADGLHNLAVTDAEGIEQLIRLREPLRLEQLH